MLKIKDNGFGKALNLVRTLILVSAALWSVVVISGNAYAHRQMVFPIAGTGITYTNSYLDPRSNGVHYAIDIFAKKHQALVSAVNGTIVYAAYPQPSYGWIVTIEDDDGWRYQYIHINNDTPGTDDGRGGAMNAYAPDIKAGNKVIRGQLIGWVGDSGNAENTPPHLHFEMFKPDGTVVNPYISLQRAKRISRPITPVTQPNEILPYGQSKRGGYIDIGNIDGDPDEEYVIAARSGFEPYVRVHDSDGTFMRQFLAYGEGFKGGVDVALGDVDNDGVDEIITGTGAGSTPRVRVFEPDGTDISGFYAYSEGFNGGINVATGDVDNDGVDEIITGTGASGPPRVRAFELDGTGIVSFYAYSYEFRGGVDVAGGDISGLNTGDEIITGVGGGAPPYVKAFGMAGNQVFSVKAYASNFHGGVRVSAGNVNGFTPLEEIVTVPYSKGPPLVNVYDDMATLIDSNHFMEEWWFGYHDIGVGDDIGKAITGVNRRTSVKPVFD